jgi:anti-sigma factor RsiW
MSTENQGQDPVACERAETLVPGYLDGELSEAQAGPLRKHLLSCPTCRGKAADLTNLKRWITAAAPKTPFAVPQGFAARVARAAFTEQPLSEEFVPRPARATAPTGPAEGSVLPFILGLTSVAAAMLLSFSFLLGVQGQPSGSDLSAQPMPDMLPEIMRQLKELNIEEDHADRNPVDTNRERGTAGRK